MTDLEKNLSDCLKAAHDTIAALNAEIGRLRALQPAVVPIPATVPYQPPVTPFSPWNPLAAIDPIRVGDFHPNPVRDMTVICQRDGSWLPIFRPDMVQQ